MLAINSNVVVERRTEIVERRKSVGVAGGSFFASFSKDQQAELQRQQQQVGGTPGGPGVM